METDYAGNCAVKIENEQNVIQTHMSSELSKLIMSIQSTGVEVLKTEERQLLEMRVEKMNIQFLTLLSYLII